MSVVSNRGRATVIALAALAAALVLPSHSRAQSLWLPRDVDRSVTLEIFKPNFDYPSFAGNESFGTMAFWLTARLPLQGKLDNLSFILQLPAAHYSGPANYDQSDTGLGNLYFGIEGHGPVFGEFGVHVPTSSNNNFNALATGAVSDIGRWESFYHDVLSVQAALHIHRVDESHLMLGLRLSGDFSIPTIGGADPEIIGGIAGRIGYEDARVRSGIGLTNRVLLTEDVTKFADRFEHQVEVHADIGSGKFRPGVDVHFPLKDLKDLVPVVYGVNFRYIF